MEKYEEWVYSEIAALRDLFFKLRMGGNSDKREFELLTCFRKTFLMVKDSRYSAFRNDPATAQFDIHFDHFVKQLDLD